MLIIGIDVGRNYVKAVTEGKTVTFRSRVGEWRERRLTSDGNYEIEINNQKYFVADLAEESYFIREMVTESKIHEETKILFLTALALISKPGEKLAVITGLPVVQHNSVDKEKLTNLLIGTYHVNVNNCNSIICIDRIGIVPEAGGAYWDMILDENGQVANSWLGNQNVRVIDIGSRTINYCTIKQCKYLDRDSGTLNYGVLELENAGVVEETKEQFARRIIADLSKKWLNYNPDNDIILLTGGGSIMLQKWLFQHFNNTHLTSNPVMANASGYYKMGVARWRGK